MINSIQCAQCKTFDIQDKSVYFNKEGKVYLGEWPLYYFGAGPYHPMDAKVYFCGASCSNEYHKEHMRDATQG